MSENIKQNPSRASAAQSIWSTAKEFWNTERKAIALAIIIFLVASLSFGLGYLANREFSHSPIIIQNNPDD